MKPDTDQESINLDKISAMLKLVDASGRDLLTTVNNLLDYDRLGGQMQIEPHVSSQSLDRIEQHVVDSVLIPSSKPELTLIADNLLPPDVEIIMTDFDLLTQCLHSVLENAVNFAEKGTIIFKMSLSEDDHSLDFEVYDSGPGIPDQDKHRIFEPFEKVNEFSRGPGLGLAISSRIALALGGRLDLVTTSSEGSMFRLRLMNAGFACSRSSKYRFITKNCRMPLTYHMPVNRELETMPLTYTARNIERLGFHEADEQHASLYIVQASGIAIDQSLKKVLGDVAGYRKIAIYVATSSDEIDDAREAARGETFEGRVVRCYAPTCRARLWTVIMKAAEIWDRLNLEDRLSESLKIEMKSVSPPRKKRSREGMRLLLVDDNKTNLGILIMYCKKRKFAYDTAMDGKEAVAKFESTVDDFSLVLMDLQMPVMDGANATKEIRTIEKTNNKRSSLIFMGTFMRFSLPP